MLRFLQQLKQANKQYSITKITIEKITDNISKTDLGRIKYVRSKDKQRPEYAATADFEDSFFQIKIYLSEAVPVTSEGISLSLEHQGQLKEIDSFSDFSEGIYFKVYNPRFFIKYQDYNFTVSLAGTRFSYTDTLKQLSNSALSNPTTSCCSNS